MGSTFFVPLSSLSVGNASHLYTNFDLAVTRERDGRTFLATKNLVKRVYTKLDVVVTKGRDGRTLLTTKIRKLLMFVCIN